jgi:hypothetical protein
MRCSVVFRRPYGWYVHTESRTSNGLWFASSPFLRISSDADAATLGDTVRSALAASQPLADEPADSRAVFQPMLKLADERSWLKFAKDSASVGVRDDAVNVVLTPSHFEGRDKCFVSLSDQEITLPAAPTREELGEALMRAAELCDRE